MGLEAGDRVPRARWFEAAGTPKKTRQRVLVELYDQDKKARDHAFKILLWEHRLWREDGPGRWRAPALLPLAS